MRKSFLSSVVVALLIFAISSNSFGEDKGITISNPGLGDVLLAPLYDVRNLANPDTREGTTFLTTQQTLILIVNTDPVNGVIARLRFKEWERGREVLDFDIPLTSNDVWVGDVSRLFSGGAAIYSPDRYVSNMPATFDTPFTTSPFPVSGFAFRPYLIESSEPNPIARTEYGYFEVIGEEKVGAMTPSGTFPRLATGVSRDVENVLMGIVYIIRPEVAISHQYNMTAIANFAIDPLGIRKSPTTVFPNLLNDVQGEGTNPGSGGFNQLEAILSKRNVHFQYSAGIDPADNTNTPMSTSVVITFPTKHFHYSEVTPYSIWAADYPYGTPFTGSRETVGDNLLPPGQPFPDYGEAFTYTIWDRSEHRLMPILPPTDPSFPKPKLPYEVNVIGLYPADSVVLGFRNNVGISTANSYYGTVFYSGWGRIDLSPDLSSGGYDTRTYVQGEEGMFNFFGNLYSAYRGLPAIGVVMTEFFNDPLRTYYGGTAPWQYSADWRTSLISTYVLQVNSSDPGVYIRLSQADNSGQKDGTAPFTRIYNQGTTVTLTAPSTYDSKSFSNWSGDADCSDGVVTMNSNKACTATFNPQVVGYTLTVIKSGTGSGTVTSSPAGIDCGDDCSETYSEVQKVKLTAKTDADSTFAGWSGECSGTGSCQVTVDGPKTVRGSFTLKIPDISVAQTFLDFGSVKVGKKVTKTLKITNNGSGDLMITLSGLEETDFGIQGSSSVTIKAKKSYSLKVVFTPTSAGSKTAKLEIHSNDPDTPTLEISMSGTGQ